MGFMLPYNFILVSKGPRVAIPVTRIATMMSTKMYQARRTVHEEKKAGTLVNACGTNAAQTAIFMDNGTVVSSPFTIPVLMNAIRKAELKANGKDPKMKEYIEEDISEEEILDDDDEEYDDDDDFVE